MNDLQFSIERFVEACAQAVISEPGEELIELGGGNLSLEERNGAVMLQAWDNRRNLVRKITGIESESRSKLVLRVERFGKKTGLLSFLDIQRADAQVVSRRTARLEFREIFRRFLRREFGEYKIVELSTEPNLEQSLSPAYPRALLSRGSCGLAAIAVAPGASTDAVLSFGLIWLDYLRRVKHGLTIHGLIVFLPSGREKNTCLRLQFLNQTLAHYSIFVYSDQGYTQKVDLADYGNIDTRLEACRGSPPVAQPLIEELSAWPGVEIVESPNASLSFRVRGLEFAKFFNDRLVWGLETKQAMQASHLGEVKALVQELLRLRSSGAEDHSHPLFLRRRELWLESQVRAQIEEIDATLCATPIHGQVPAFAAGDRGVIDLLAVDRTGRLAVIELKTSQDIHLPLQALDYWIRVKWHLERGDFLKYGYFPRMELRMEAPRLLLVAPALEFHPSNERVLRFFSPQVQVQRLGVGLEWQQRLRLMYRM